MAPYDPFTEDFSPPASSFNNGFVPRNVTRVYRRSTSTDVPSDNNVAWAPQQQNRSSSLTSSPSPVVLSQPTWRGTEHAAGSARLPIRRRRPSVFRPRVDIEDGAPSVCPCCHLRRRSSAESTEQRSPKYIHTVLDECWRNFCPDLSLPRAGYSPPRSHSPHVGHSPLCEQLPIPRSQTSDEVVDLSGSTPGSFDGFDSQCNQDDLKISPCVTSSSTTCTEDDDDDDDNNNNSCWSARDFD